MFAKRKLIEKLKFLLCLSAVLFFAALINAQAQTNQTADEPFDSPTSPPTCEEWIAYVSKALGKWYTNKKGSFIVISRLGRSESRRLHAKRIKTIKEFFSSLKVEGDVIFAEGERNDDFPTISLYVEGKLIYTLPIVKNGNAEFRACQFA